MSKLAEMYQKQRDKIASSQGGERAVALKAGKNILRILPSWKKGSPVYWHQFAMHYIKNGDATSAYVCGSKTYDQECEICNLIANGISNAMTDADKKAFTDARSNMRYLINAIDMQGDMETPVVISIPPTLFDGILNIGVENLDEDRPNFDPITDLKEGLILIVNKTGTGLATEYSVTPVTKKSKPLSPAIVSKIRDLDDFVAKQVESGRAKTLPSFITKSLPKPTSGGGWSASEAFDDDVEYYESPEAESAPESKKSKPKPKAKDEELGDDDLDDLLSDLD